MKRPFEHHVHVEPKLNKESTSRSSLNVKSYEHCIIRRGLLGACTDDWPAVMYPTSSKFILYMTFLYMIYCFLVCTLLLLYGCSLKSVSLYKFPINYLEYMNRIFFSAEQWMKLIFHLNPSKLRRALGPGRMHVAFLYQYMWLPQAQLFWMGSN